MDVKTIIEKLGLAPLPVEGGYFQETYRSNEGIPLKCLPDRYSGSRSFCTAIYYLITPEIFSAIHRVKSDEIFHFYAGDPVEMLQLHPDGSYSIEIIGNDIMQGESPQVIVPKGIWQGCRLVPGGKYALMGTTVAPGFDYADYEHGEREALIAQYPECAEMIVLLARS